MLWVNRALQVVAALVFLSVLAAALHDVSYAWDVWYYHLPFAARVAGVVPAGSFVFHPANQARYEGYPLFGELLEGVLWRATGRPESASLVSFACIPMFAWFLRRRFAVPLHVSVLALLAIPLVQAHASSCYVDLPANTAVAVLVLLAVEAHARRSTRVGGGTLALAGAAAAVAVNTKVLAGPLVLAALVALGTRVGPDLARDLRTDGRRRARWTLAALTLAALVVFATPLKNVALHHNPFFPEKISILGHELPGVEEPYSSSPRYLAHAPEPVRFACSVLEIGIRPLTDRRRWTVDQFMPADSTGPRMGGFFGAYVIAELAMLGWQLLRDRSGKAKAIGAGFALLTALTSVMPQAHELRYYLAWMIVLVAMNRWLACTGKTDASRANVLVGTVSLAALVVVVVVTHGAYAYPSGSTFAELVGEKVDARALDRIGDGEQVCVRKAPWNLLWAPEFHAPRRYVVREAEEEGECEGARPVD